MDGNNKKVVLYGWGNNVETDLSIHCAVLYSLHFNSSHGPGGDALAQI